ncbi:hypothetical protein MRX96_045777 [Rhipicephalus microplus]
MILLAEESLIGIYEYVAPFANSKDPPELQVFLMSALSRPLVPTWKPRAVTRSRSTCRVIDKQAPVLISQDGARMANASEAKSIPPPEYSPIVGPKSESAPSEDKCSQGHALVEPKEPPAMTAIAARDMTKRFF